MALYMIGFITYGATLVFYAAVFPRLARNTAHARSLKEKLDNGQISQDEYELEESLEKNRISNISTVSPRESAKRECGCSDELKMHSNVGYVITLCLNLSLLLPLAKDPKVNNYVLVLCVG